MTVCFKLYKMCTLLHRSKLKSLAKKQFESFRKKNFANVAKSAEFAELEIGIASLTFELRAQQVRIISNVNLCPDGAVFASIGGLSAVTVVNAAPYDRYELGIPESGQLGNAKDTSE